MTDGVDPAWRKISFAPSRLAVEGGVWEADTGEEASSPPLTIGCMAGVGEAGEP